LFIAFLSFLFHMASFYFNNFFFENQRISTTTTTKILIPFNFNSLKFWFLIQNCLF
jgi:hypothetical protein